METKMKSEIIVILVLTFTVLLLCGCIDNSPYVITEIGRGTIEKVEGNAIYFGNDSFSGIVKDDGSIQWDGLSQWGFILKIDNLNGFDISNLTGKYVEIRLHGTMNEKGYLISKIISLNIMR